MSHPSLRRVAATATTALLFAIAVSPVAAAKPANRFNEKFTITDAIDGVVIYAGSKSTNGSTFTVCDYASTDGESLGQFESADFASSDEAEVTQFCVDNFGSAD